MKALWLGIAGSFLVPAAAEACGGCFCTVTSTETVDQSAERVLFELEDGPEGGPAVVTAHVHIAYTGAAESFAWVVPIPSLPRDLGTSPNAMFDEIDQGTAPSFTFITNRSGGAPSGCFGCCGASAASDGAGGDGGDPAEEVTVWNTENVGPYDTQTISGDDGSVLYDWLVDNGYEVPVEAEPIIASYVATGSYFLAMQLEEGASIDQIEPIRFTYDGNEPCIPLKLTAIATVPDLPVLAFVFASARTIPENFAQTEPDWNSLVLLADNTTNYKDLVTDAADGAGGRAFVTEFAGPTDQIGQGGYYYDGFSPTDPTLIALIARHPYLTRLYTTISANEMTIDPIFRLDPAAPDVSNFRTIDLTVASGALAAKTGRAPATRTASSLSWTTFATGIVMILVLGYVVRRRRQVAAARPARG